MSDESIERFQGICKGIGCGTAISIKKIHGQPGSWEAGLISFFKIPEGSVPWEKKLEEQV